MITLDLVFQDPLYGRRGKPYIWGTSPLRCQRRVADPGRYHFNFHKLNDIIFRELRYGSGSISRSQLDPEYSLIQILVKIFMIQDIFSRWHVLCYWKKKNIKSYFQLLSILTIDLNRSNTDFTRHVLTYFWVNMNANYDFKKRVSFTDAQRILIYHLI